MTSDQPTNDPAPASPATTTTTPVAVTDRVDHRAPRRRPGRGRDENHDHSPTFPESRLRITVWPDPVLDALGHDPRSSYVEQFWLSVLGPSAVLLLRRLAAALEVEPDGFDLDPLRWSQELGLGTKGGRHSPFWRTVDRSCRFGATHRNGEHLAVRRRLAPLSARQIERLPDHLRRAHDDWAAVQLARPRRRTVARWSHAGPAPLPSTTATDTGTATLPAPDEAAGESTGIGGAGVDGATDQ
ncbi:MAG: hypothetical protein ACFCVK_15330 [Acidimicrobiales bacterium]